MGFEPMSAAVKGQCVKPLHQLAIIENKGHILKNLQNFFA